MEICDEFEGLDLGDSRLDSRVKSAVQAIAQAPSESFPQVLKSEAELEGWYRLLSNPQASFSKLLLPHQRKSVERVQQSVGTVIVSHDTTEISFSSTREGLGRAQEEREGKVLFLHVALVLSLQGERRHPLGVLHAEPYVRTGKPRRKKSQHSEKRPPSKRESIRWVKGVDRVVAELGEQHRSKVIHVMDREADMYTLLSQMMDVQARFVIRAKHKRGLLQPVSTSSALFERSIELNARIHKTKGHLGQPPRAARKATIQVTARSVTVTRPGTDEKHKHPPRPSLTLNQVLVREVNVPEGHDPVQWTLWTTEPIETEQDLEHIVDVYRARWLIEEFFKALKTGCAYEKRQLESKDTLLTALAMLLPIAYQLLALRTAADAEPDTPAHQMLSEDQLQVLKTHRVTASMPVATVYQALLAIARLGGHLKRNGPPGWMVLYRGLAELRQLEIGFQLAKSSLACDLS